MSRAFGNRMLKQFVVAEPEIQVALSNCLICYPQFILCFMYFDTKFSSIFFYTLFIPRNIHNTLLKHEE